MVSLHDEQRTLSDQGESRGKEAVAFYGFLVEKLFLLFPIVHFSLLIFRFAVSNPPTHHPYDAMDIVERGRERGKYVV